METNWLRERSKLSSRSLIMLNARPTCANSLLPRMFTRLEKSPLVMRKMPWLSASMGLVKKREMNMLITTTHSATTTSQITMRF